MARSSVDRIADIWKSGVSDVLDRLEDPEKMARQLVRDMESDVERATQAVAAALANQRRLQSEFDDECGRIGDWQSRAERAMAAGDEEGARRALEHKLRCSRAADEAKPDLEESRQVAAQLQEQLGELAARLRQARRRQGTLIARLQAAQSRGDFGTPEAADSCGAHPSIQRLEEQINDHQNAFERLVEQAEIAEAQADVNQELADGHAREERRVEAREAEERLEEELAELKRRATTQQ